MKHTSFDLRGLNVLITGAATGIGAKIVELCVAGGANIGLHYYQSSKSAEKLKQELGGSTHIELFNFDLRESITSAGLVVAFLNKFKKIDVLINNAGGVLGVHHFLDLDEKSWDETFALNTKSAFFISREAFKVMKQQNSGKIINISSVASKYGGSDQTMHYAAAKTAVESLTLGMARYGAPHNILVNCIRGGFIDTEFHQKMGRTPVDIKKRIELIPLKRAGKPEDIAHMAVYLASSCGDFITGQIISVSGGD